MTNCQIKAKETIIQDIRKKALSNKSWNAHFSVKESTVRVFFPFTEKPTTLKLENSVAYKNARDFKKLLESTYRPSVYKETAFINKATRDGVEIVYNIPFKLIEDQESKNNITEDEKYESLQKLEEEQQKNVNEIVYENIEDYINDEGDVRYVITRVFQDGTVQISKLTRIEDLDELKKKLYKREEQKYKYSADLSIEAQERITEQLTGMLMDSVSNDLLNKKQPKIFFKEKVIIDGKEKEITFLTIRKSLTDRLLELHKKYKEKTLSPKEQDEYFYLRIVWNPKTFLKIQHDIVNRFIARGYKFKNGKVELQQDDGNLVELYEAISDTESEDFELSEGITGKSDQLSDYSALTTSNKEKMSSKLRTFLSSIKSDKEALINLKIGNKVYNTQYVNEGVVIQAINEVTLGLNTYEEMVQALRLASQYVKGREFLSQVVEKLAVERAKGTEIVNQFVDKFNQQKNDLTLVTFDKRPIVAYRFRKGEKIISVPLKNDNNKTIFFYDYRVINANRNDIFINLKNDTKQRFIETNELDTEEVPFEKLKNAAATYTLFKDYVKDNYKDGRFSNAEEAKEKLKELFETLSFEFSDDFYEELVENKRNKLQVSFNLDGKGKSLFNKKFGALHNIFGNLESAIVEKKNLSLDQIFGNSGATRLLKLEAEMKEYYYNTSTLDGKGRNIWGYSMPSPMFRELFDILNNDRLAELKADPKRSLYTSSSYILSEMASLPTEERKLFIENIKYSLFNVLKQKNKESKELNEMEEAEFIATQIILHIGNEIKTGKNTYWSNKFLTTPSDKTTMYIVQTPNTYINVETVDGVVKAKIDLNSEILARFYNYFLGEYRRAKAYQDADPATKEKIDALGNYEPLLFYSFPQLNLKNDDNILWKRQGDTWVLRDLNEVVGNLDVESYVKSELLQQLRKEVENVRQKLQKVGLIQNNKFINGFPSSYRKRVPDSVSLATAIKAKEKEFKDSEKKSYLEQLKDLYNQSDINLTDYLVHDYALNYLLHNIEMHTLILGDPVQYLKDEKSKFINNPKIFNSNDIREIIKYIDDIRDNLSKRMAGAQANRMEGDTNNETCNIVTLVDTPTNSKIIEEIERFNPDKTDRYKAIKSMDGQELITAEEDLKQKLIHGKISRDLYQILYNKVQKQHEDIEKYGFVTEENKFTEEEQEKFIAQPIKPVLFGNVYDQELKIFKLTYYKDSAFGLYPQLTQGFELDKVRKGLYNLSKKGIVVDRIVMKSAVKSGIKNPIANVFNPDFTVNQEAIERITEDNIDVVPRKLQGIQLEVPYDPFKTEIRIGSQQIKLIFNEILDVSWDNQTNLINKFLPELKDKKVTGRLLKNYHSDVYRQLVELSLDSILDEIGVEVNLLEGTYTFRNLTKLKKTLEKTAVSLGYSNLALESLSITPDGKEFVLPISFNENSDRLEKLLLSILNKAILQKISGRSFILASEMGFVLNKSWINELRKKKAKSKEITENVIEGEEAKRIVKEYQSSIVFTDKFDIEKGLLPARRKNPSDKNSEILPAQVLVPWKFTYNGEKIDIGEFVIEKDSRKLLDTSKIDPEILRVFGIRIPTQGHPSMVSIEIVGFLPEFMGDIIIAPQDFVAMMGSDFDIDKLYGYIYNYFYDKRAKKISKLKFNESKIQEIDEEELFLNSDEDFTEIFDIVEKKKQAQEKYVKGQKRKMLQNKLIDIYHTIMLHPAVYDKSLEGITEGNLGELSKELKSLQGEKDYNYYSPFSIVNKIDEYFENKAGKLGVGVFSINSTFFSVVEGLGLELQKITVEKDENGKDVLVTVPDYFSIPLNKNNKTDAKGYYVIAGAKGFNRLVSMFQSASVDNAKLKYLNWISINKETMGVASLLSSLADDNVLGEDGKPLLNEDYIVYFLSQPIIKEYVNAINGQNAFSADYVDSDQLVLDLMYRYETKIKNELSNFDAEKKVDYLNQLKEDPIYTLEELKDFVKNSSILNNDINYLLAQYQILNKFLKLKEQANVLRQLQYLINADSKGLPSTLAEANYKSIRVSEFIEKGSPIIKNVRRVFVNESDKEVNVNKELADKKDIYDSSLMTLQGYLENIADSVSTRIFSKNNNIIASGSTHIEHLTEIISTLSGKKTNAYPYNLVNKITKSYLAFLQSTNNMEIQDPGRTFKEEIVQLLKDTETSTSLATDLENFKKTGQYKESIVLKPFLESLRVRTFEGFKFVEYSSSQGLLNTDEQIVQALLELQDLDGKNGTYPLFAKLVKYTFLVKIQKSPITIKQFIPIYMQEALGITSKLRAMNQFLNSKKEGFEGLENYEIPLAILRYEADGYLPVYTFVEQFYQHYPEELKFVAIDDFVFLDENNNVTDETTERIFIKGTERDKYTNIINGKEFELPYVSVYNIEEKRLNIFRKVENKEGVYEKIPNLGRYNFDEFNADALSTATSILPSNKLKNLPQVNKSQVAATVQSIPSSPKDFTLHSEGANQLQKRNIFTVKSIKSVDKKAIVKASVATQYIGFAEGIEGSSTENYRQQILEQSTKKVSAKGKMTFFYGSNKRSDVKSNTTFEAIKNGERTATTRYESDGHIDYWKNLKVGDVIEWESATGEKIKVEVTKPLHKLVGSNKTAEQWSKLEGWSVDYFNSKVKPRLNEAWQIEYKPVQSSIVNSGNYSSTDVIFVSIVGKRGNEAIRKAQQDKTIKEAIKAIEAGATLVTDNVNYIHYNSKTKTQHPITMSVEDFVKEDGLYNEGEKRLYENLKARGYIYFEQTIDGEVLGVWRKPHVSSNSNIQGIEINSYQTGLGNDLTNVHYANKEYPKSKYPIIPSNKELKLTQAAKSKWGESVEAWYKSNNSKAIGIPEGETTINPDEYTNHSGGALGADSEWDIIGQQFGFKNNKHYYHGSKTPRGNSPITDSQLKEGIEQVKKTYSILGRPDIPKYYPLHGRNWFQVKNADAVFAISDILNPGEKDKKGYVQKSEKQVVAGGTGYAVEMAIQNNKPVYVFHQKTAGTLEQGWYKWNYTTNQFDKIDTPILTKNFAGIGTREINEAGKKAIKDVYQKTLQNGENQADKHDFDLMVSLITDKLTQYPDLVRQINERGGLEFLQKSTHTMGNGRWSSKNPKNMFMRSLIQAYKNASQILQSSTATNRNIDVKPNTEDPQIKQIIDFYNGLTNEQRRKIGSLDELIDRFINIPFGYDARSFISDIREELITTSEPIRVFTNVADNQQAKGNNVLASYGVTDNQTDSEKIKTILDKISVDSKEAHFRELANLLKQLDRQFNFTSNLKVNFVENEDSFYNPNDNSINLNISQKDSQGRPIPPFSERIQFEILHELIHSVLDSRLGLDQAGTIVLNRIKRLTKALESEESLKKAIELFGLKDDSGNKATVEYLLDKLAKLRATTQDTDSVKYNSEAERSVLNPLINEREFIASVLGDNRTRIWMNEVQYDETGSILSKIIDAFKTFFNNLIRSFGFEIKQKSALEEAINITLDLINYEVSNSTEIVEFLEFGNYYRFELDRNGTIIKGEYSQGNRNNYKPLTKPSKKYVELSQSATSKKLTTNETKASSGVITAPSVSGKKLQGEQVGAFQKATVWLNKPGSRKTTEGNLTDEDILDNMFLLSGPGGSGKTFITEIIISELLKNKDAKIIAVAPTHPAKNVLKENIPNEVFATTLQALLGLLPNPINKSTFIGETLDNIEEMYIFGKALPIFSYDYIFIDEASMIDGSKPLIEKEYKRVWSDIENEYVDKVFYENPDLGTYLKEVIKLKYRFTGKMTKVFLMGDIVQVVPVGAGRFQISKILTDLLKMPDNHALLNEIRRTDNQEIKKLSLALRESFNKIFKDNNASVDFIAILNSVKPNQNITLLNSKKALVDNFIKLYKENIESGNPIPNYTNIIWYNNSVNQKTVDLTNVIRRILFNNNLEINLHENLILKSNYTIKDFFGEGKNLFLGSGTKLIITSVEDGFSSFTLGKKRSRNKKLVSNIPVKILKANVQIGSATLKDVPITIVTPSYFQKLGNKFAEERIFVEGQHLTKGELYELIESLTTVEYGYVINSHQIQGSKVINPIVDIENIVNSPEDELHLNNMIYTAISRAVNSLYIYHPKLTPKEGKPISKLTGVNNPQKPPVKETTTAKDLSLDYLTQRLHLQYSKRAKIYSDKTLTEEEKRQKLLSVETVIARLQANIQSLSNNFFLAEYFRIAQKELNDLTEILNKNEVITEEDFYQAVQIFGYFHKLYSEINQQYTVYNDDFSDGNKEYVDPELYLKVKEYNEIANSNIDKLVNLGLKFYQAFYNKHTGRAIGMSEFLASQESSWARSNILSTHESKQQFIRSVSKIVSDMVRQTKQNIVDHEQEDLVRFREFEKDFSFKDLIRIVEYTDSNNVKRKESILISRNTINYYNAKSKVFKDAERISDKALKVKDIKRELSKISYDIDSRFLFVDEYLQEMREYYKDDSIQWVDEKSRDFYLEKILNFHKEQLSEYGEDYAQFRTNEVLKQARRKMQAYLDKKEAFKMSLETQSLTEQEKKDRLQDWISYNSPFLLLNEMYGLSTEEGAYVNKEWKTPPQEVNVKTFTTKSGKVLTERPFIDYRLRHAKDFITNKARYKFEDGSLTGFYDEDYSKMEQEMLEREYRALELERKGDQIGADNERKRKIKWDYFKFVEERQRYYLEMLPYHITKELRWFNLIDVERDYKEQFNEILQPILSFKGESFLNFLKLDLLKLIKLSLSFIHDKALRKFVENHISEIKLHYDFVTGQIKLNYDPSGFNNTLNKLGAGHLRTTDVFNYFSYLRSAAIQYQERSQAEEIIKIGQFLAKSAKIIDASSSQKIHLNNLDIDGLNWHVNSKLYGAKREEIYKGTEHELWKVITNNNFVLTKNEREKKRILTQRIAYLKHVLATTTDLKAMTQIANEINLAELQLASIKKEINKYTLFGSYSWYVALKRLSFGTTGRLLDFLSSTLMGGLKQAIDGRIYGLESYFKAFYKVMSIYFPDAASSIFTAAGVASLNPSLVATGVGMRFTKGAVDQLLRKKEVAKINQILYRLGALEYLNYKEDDNISTFVNKTNLTDEALAAIKTLNPFSSLSQIDIINKSVPTLAVLYETKVKDVNGKEHPLIEAFDVDEDLNLIWKESEFGSQDDAGFNWYKGFDMQKVISKIYAVQTFVNGDYDVTKSRYGDTKITVRALMLLRRFMGEFLKSRFGSPSIEEDSGNLYMGSYRGLSLTLKRTIPFFEKEKESPEFAKARKIAAKQISFDIVILSAMGLVGYMLKESLKGDDNDDESKELSFWQRIEYYTITAIERVLSENFQFIDPNIIKGKANTGAISPVLSDLMDLYNLGQSLYRAILGEDEMTHREMIAKGLAPINPKKSVYIEGTQYNFPKFEERYYDPLTGETYVEKIELTETGRIRKYKVRVGKYSKNYKEMSRFLYNIKKATPFMNLYLKYQRDQKKARELKNEE